MPESEFINLVDKNVKNHQYVDKVLEYLNVSGDNIPNEILDFINEASKFGLNLIYDPSIVRGLDYYTGSVTILSPLSIKEYASSTIDCPDFNS